MREFLNVIVSFVLTGAMCFCALFLLKLTDFKGEIWEGIYERSDK